MESDAKLSRGVTGPSAAAEPRAAARFGLWIAIAAGPLLAAAFRRSAAASTQGEGAAGS